MAFLSRHARLTAAACRSALLMFFLLAVCAGQTSPGALNGHWQLELSFPDGLTTKLDLVIEQTGINLGGAISTATGDNRIKGTIKESEIEFTELVGKGYDAQFKGKQTGDNILEGTMDAPPFGPGKWTAKR